MSDLSEPRGETFDAAEAVVAVLERRGDLRDELDAYLDTLAPGPHRPALVALGLRGWLEDQAGRVLHDEDMALLVGLRTLCRGEALATAAQRLVGDAPAP